MVHASLFSGIGGPEVAARMMGWVNAFHCEINPFGRRILDYHFPESESYEDITKTDFRKWRGKIDVLTGGFPCQPFSVAGRRKGAEDDRYLWPQFIRVIREVRPAWVVGENVAGILTMVQPGEAVNMGRSSSLFGDGYEEEETRQQYVVETICRDLESEGYSVQPFVIPACAVGAPHRRDRVFFVANSTDARVEKMQQEREDGVLSNISAAHSERCGSNELGNNIQPGQSDGNRTDLQGSERVATDTLLRRCDRRAEKNFRGREALYAGERVFAKSERHGESKIATHSDGKRCDNRSDNREERQFYCDRERDDEESESKWRERECGTCKDDAVFTYTESQQCERDEFEQRDIGEQEQGEFGGIGSEDSDCKRSENFWADFPTTEPAVRRGDDGISERLDGITISKWRQESLKAYGNAIVPQVMYEIFRAIEIVEKEIKK